MKNYLLILVFSLVCLSSCQADEDSLAFIIPDNVAEIAEVSLTVKQNGASFYYLLGAYQLIVNWGDGSPLAEYQNPETNQNWITLNPLLHKYTTTGSYNLNIRMLAPNVLNLSNTDSLASFIDITNLDLTNCVSLEGLYLRKQTLSKLDLSDTENLQILNLECSNISQLNITNPLQRLTSLFIDSTQIRNFDCLSTPNIQALSIGMIRDQQDIRNIDSLHRLESLMVRGNIKQTVLSVINNDSLQIFGASNSNITDIDLKNLHMLSSINVNMCNKIESIALATNDSLQTISLTNNSTLSAQALNSIFSALPTASGDNTIFLWGNPGDATCDKTIATAKGWVFK